MATPAVPVVNLGEKYINGFNLSWLTATTLSITAGQARDSTNTCDILYKGQYQLLNQDGMGLNPDVTALPATMTINAAANGLNGLDTGALANNTMYAVYVVSDSYSNNPTGALLSASLTVPAAMPNGYDIYRRIGYVLTSGAAAILEFRQVGSSVDRWMWYDVGIQELAAGASAAYAAVNIATSVPATATAVLFDVLLTPTAAADAVHLQPTGATGANGYAILSGAVAGVVQRAPLVVPCNSTPSIDYKVTGTVTLNTQAYLDQLV